MKSEMQRMWRLVSHARIERTAVAILTTPTSRTNELHAIVISARVPGEACTIGKISNKQTRIKLKMPVLGFPNCFIT
jgi:hypothetical protein